MFGYVRPYQPSLVVSDREFYRALYCGVCRAMKKRTGALSAFSLNYDFVFLALVRLLTEENHISIRHRRCIAHPLRRRPMVSLHPATEYAARVSAVLVYYKLKDDIADSRFLGKLPPAAALPVFASARRRARLGRLDTIIADCISRLSALEREKCPSIDAPASVFGELLGEVFAYEIEGEMHDVLYRLGNAVGKFIYAADAADDYEDDVKHGGYNPYVLTYGKILDDNARRDIHASLICMLAAEEEAFAALPFASTVTVRRIIENILYEGLPRRVAFLENGGVKKLPKHAPYDGVLP